MRLLQSIKDQIENIVGKGGFDATPESIQKYSNNTTEFDAPSLLGIAKPETVAAVQALVAFANTEGIVVYPISTGFNWGLGSKLPTAENTILIDLGKLNKIREVHNGLRYAIIEPGVSQKQLSDYLKANNTNLIANITGSSPGSSYIGNLLERGTSFLRHKVDFVRAFEVVLPTGEMVRTGFWESENDQVSVLHYKHGMGPNTTDLFFQSNYGVVTAAVVSLLPRQEETLVLWAQVAAEKLEPFLEQMKLLYGHQLLSNTTHIGNDKRMKLTNAETLTWTAFCAISGPKAINKVAVEMITQKLSPFCKKLSFMTEDDANASTEAYEKDMYKLHTGQPAEVFLNAMFRSHGDKDYTPSQNVDDSNIGMLCCLPIMPFSQVGVQIVLKCLKEVEAEFATEPAVTLNPINDLYLEAVINIYFDRDNIAERDRAHKANSFLHKRLYELGLRFYRLDIKEMALQPKIDSPHNRLTATIKQSLDPKGTIAPGRYIR